MIALTWRSAVLLAASTALLACGDNDAKTRVTDAETAPTDTAATDTTRETTGDTTLETAGETDTTATDTTRDTTGDTTLETTGDTTLETTGETGETDDDTALGPESSDSEAPEADGTDCTGDGGCTSDPCTPSPCAANELCNATAGSASCTACPEDPEPCTRAIAVAGTCGVVTLDDGEPCTTSSCRVGQTCQAGHCTTGVARTCTTDNPCMTSACVEGTGCSLTPNDTVIPDDGVACTVDRCQSGMAIHAPRDALCGRSFFCGGLHRCDPDAIDADDSGCAAALAPPTDTPCDDTIACTGHDRCRADQVCRGDIERDCGWATACTTTVPLGAILDLPTASLTGTITLNGQKPPATGKTGQWAAAFYLVARDTGARHRIGDIGYHYNSGALQGGTIDTVVIPGVYDLLYVKAFDTNTESVALNQPAESLVNGLRILQRDVIVGVGENVLDIDVPWSHVNGTITLNGAPPAATGKSGQWSGVFYLVAKDTGARHPIGSIGYHYNSGALQGGTIDTVVMPGTYDLLYAKDYDPDLNAVGDNAPNETLANGYRILRTNVVIATDATTLDIDVAWGAVTGLVTLNGEPPATSGKSGQWAGAFYLVAKDTGAHHHIGAISYHYNSGALQGGVIDTLVMPGTYDLLYAKDYDRASNAVGDNAPDETLANGYRILRKDLTITDGDNVLDIDVAWSALTGTVTLNGHAPATTGKNGQWAGAFYLVAKDTGAQHLIGSIGYHYNSGALQGGTIDTVVMPGTYDLLYAKDYDRDGATVGQNAPDETLANGYRILRRGLAIADGDNVLDIDVAWSAVTGTVTLNGQPPAPTGKTGQWSGAFYLVAKDTGAHHLIGTIGYHYNSGALQGGTIDTVVMPGTYDLWYAKDYDRDQNAVGLNTPDESLANGYRILRKDLAIVAGANRLDIDVPWRSLDAAITLDGQAPGPTGKTGQWSGVFSLVPLDTLAEHPIGSVAYHYNSGALMGGSIDTVALPGTYHLLYRKGFDATYAEVSENPPDQSLADGYRLLQQCVNVQ